MDPTKLCRSGSSTKTFGVLGSSSGISRRWSSCLSGVKRIAPSRGPASRARNNDRIEPIDDIQNYITHSILERDNSPVNVIEAARAHGKRYGYLTKILRLANASGHLRAGDSTTTEQ
jgi:hypothetical protein